MFINKRRLHQPLTPSHYSSAEQYRREIDRVFRPSWHLVGTVHDLPRSGDFLTTTLYETPVLLRNFDGELRAFLNVCVHRHALLSSQSRGHSDVMRCQYHGWEYKEDGRTGRIPDAGGFRPWDREAACLTQFRVECCGELVFVSLDRDAPSLQQFLGPLWSTWFESFKGERFRLAGHWEFECTCNWKIPTENSLESYHTPVVHERTFGAYPAESHCVHALEDRYSTFTTLVRDGWVKKAQHAMVRTMGLVNTSRYEHQLVYPNLQLSKHDTVRLAMVVVPTSPTSSVFRSWLYTAHGTRRSPQAAFSRFAMRAVMRGVTRYIQREDMQIFPALQMGLSASVHTGMLSPREERVFAFQEFVRARTQLPAKSLTLARDLEGAPAERSQGRRPQ